MEHAPDRLTLLKCAAFMTWQMKAATGALRTSRTSVQKSSSRPEIVFITEERCVFGELKRSVAQKIKDIMDKILTFHSLFLKNLSTFNTFHFDFKNSYSLCFHFCTKTIPSTILFNFANALL
jgi:hypothetical protein